MSSKPHNDVAPRFLLNAQDAATALSISPRLLWTKTKSGEIPHLRIGHRVLYPQHQLREYVAQQVEGVGE